MDSITWVEISSNHNEAIYKAEVVGGTLIKIEQSNKQDTYGGYRNINYIPTIVFIPKGED